MSISIKKFLKSNDDEIIKEYNKNLVEKYPWIIPPKGYNEFGEQLQEEYDYSWTMLDGIPDGWRIAFQDAMCDEIQEEYNKLSDEDKKEVYIVQAKEKFGTLRIYMSHNTCKSIEKIIDKYYTISELTCIVCGKPATYISTGWIEPYCTKHTEGNISKNYIKVADLIKNKNITITQNDEEGT